MRVISTRFVKTYPVENNEWGDFQVCELLLILNPGYLMLSFMIRLIEEFLVSSVLGNAPTPRKLVNFVKYMNL